MAMKKREGETWEEFKARQAARSPEEVEYEQNCGVPVIRCYSDAWAHWESKGNERPRPNGDRFLGDRKFATRLMRVNDDDSISMFYKGEHLITYHTDDTVSVSGMISQANADPAPRIFPIGLLWFVGTRSGPIILSFPPGAKNNHWWHLRRDKTMAPKCLVVRGRPDHPARMQLVGERWEPVDLDALELFTWTTFDKSAARGASSQQGIPDFVSALDAYVAMGVDMPPFEKDVSDAELLSRLRKRDFIGVMAGMPRNAVYSGWTPGNPSKQIGETVKPSALAKLRTRAIVEAGATFTQSQGLLTLPEWVKVEGQMKRFEDTLR